MDPEGTGLAGSYESRACKAAASMYDISLAQRGIVHRSRDFVYGDLSRFAKQIAEGPMREFSGFSWQRTYRWRPIPVCIADRGRPHAIAAGEPHGRTNSQQAAVCRSVSIVAYRQNLHKDGQFLTGCKGY